ncbi:MAG: hypothetical protein WCO65_01580 [bacterium]
MNEAIEIFVPTIVAFFVGIGITPIISHYLYKWQLWKKSSVSKTIDGREATISNKLHNDEARKTPRMGGIIVWASVLITIYGFYLLSLFFPYNFSKLSFLSRNQTWLPLFTLISASLVGLIDDFFVTRDRGTFIGGGLSLSKRLLVVFCIGIVGGLWFYFKLGMTSIHIPFDPTMLNLGYLFIPFFVLTMLAMYSGGIIDGVDGLAGGVFAIIFSALSIIAYSHNQIDLASFSLVVTGGLLVFLWFNIPPARFFLSETGTMGLTTTATVIAFLTGEVLLLPIIALPLLLTTLSVIIQLTSKKFRNGKKVFLVAPLHNHFIAKGWTREKVTMRYWVFSLICAVIGIVFALVS